MIQEQSVSINFAKGLDTKTDPWQVQIGNFLRFKNSVFQVGNLLSKRDGYGVLSSSIPLSDYVTTLNGNLLTVGNTVNAFSPPTQSWISKGSFQPCSLSVMPLIRNTVNQIQTDSVSTNGLICVVFTQTYSLATGPVTSYLYAIENEETGQNVIPATAIPVLATGVINGSSRVFLVGSFFVIVSPVAVAGTTYLQYVSIPVGSPTAISAAQNTFTEAYVPLLNTPGWDGVVSQGNLVLAYNTTAIAQGIHVTFLTTQDIAANNFSTVTKAYANAAYKAGSMSMCIDHTGSPDNIYVNFWNPTTTDGYTFAVYLSFGAINTVFNPVKSISTLAVTNLASIAQNGSCQLFIEAVNSYVYDSAIPSNYINTNTINNTGTVGSAVVSIRSVGLASKAFLVNATTTNNVYPTFASFPSSAGLPVGTLGLDQSTGILYRISSGGWTADQIAYYLAAYQSSFQPTYFLINGTSSLAANPIIVAKLAYQNGGGYLAYGLPYVLVNDQTAAVSYLYKQDVNALTVVNNTKQTTTGGIYSQLGINQVSFNLGTTSITSAEIAKDLHLSGGYLAMFDGFYPVEHNFFLFPDSVEATFTANSVKTPTGTFASGATTLTVSSASGLEVGMTITDTSNAYIPAGTVITYINGTTVTISQATTHSAAGDNLSIQGNIVAQPDAATNTNAYYYSATYEWTDMQGNAFRSTPSIPVAVTTSGAASTGIITVNVPTLRLTQKTHSLAKIVIYRWSIATQVYNQVTTINAPVLNDTTADYIGFVDVSPDNTTNGAAGVVGNNLLYTTGGVVPDTNGPASDIVTLFDTRLFLISSEDPNVLWASKTVIESTPVEMSTGFTIYVAPNVGTTSSTGPMTAIFPMDDKLVIFKKNAIFYLNGTGPDNLGTTAPGSPLGSYSQPIFITSVVGCTNQQSIVLTQDGLMFQSDKGIWLLGRSLQTVYIGAPVEAYNSATVTSATVIPDTNFVLFTLNSGVMLMYDYYYSQWGTFEGVTPVISSCIYNNLHTVLDSYGRLLQQTPGEYLDGSTPVVMGVTTAWINLASLQGYERFYEFYLLAKYISPHTLYINTAYNYNPSSYHQSVVRPTNFSGSTPSGFGVPVPLGGAGNLEQWRIHAKQQLCQSFQINIDEVFDPSLGTVAGAGLTMSGITCKVGIKKAMRPIKGANTVG